MNRKGITFLYNIMLGTIIIVLALALFYGTKVPIDEARTNAQCIAPASDYDEAFCALLDITKFVFPGALLFIGIYVLTRR